MTPNDLKKLKEIWKNTYFVFKVIITVIGVLLFFTSILFIKFWGIFIWEGLWLPWDDNLKLSTLINAESFWRFALVVIAILAAPFTIWRIIISERQVRITRDSHFTDLFTRAVDQIRKEKQGEPPDIGTKLGGIYGLEQVARNSRHYHWPIMEILMAYIRQNTKEEWERAQKEGQEAQEEEQASETVSIDIQAALTVIGRRSKERRSEEEKENQRLNLSSTYLKGANLNKAHLEHANLCMANLEGANLFVAHLELAFLAGANLEGANLFGADLENANLCSTKAASATYLTQEQIDTTFGDAATTLPGNLTRHRDWSKKELDLDEALSEWIKWAGSQK